MRVKDVIERAAALYNDLEYVRVPLKTYLSFLDDAIIQLILSRPDAHVAHKIVQLQQGTKQDIPADGYTLIDIYMNKKKVQDEQVITDEVTGDIIETIPAVFQNGRPVYQVQRKDLDYFYNWQGGDTAANLDYINEFAYDERSPSIFWVTPFVGDKEVFVDMDYSYGCPKYGQMFFEASPFEVLNTEIPINDTFFGPLTSYMLYLLYSTDSTSVVDREVASKYEQSFYQALGLEYNAVNIVKPKLEDHEVAAAIREGS